ncbi:anhydro-N-acetylmuramic acid kinase [Solirubrobacter sp. CPCC 204708]|uniref:Anhydro-N-acetylmuramic acid kinase n=1 Tax=Solirubrobacter deserti TaxID=2282478 RepID=A0ABT4REA3_9ACTN|nr:anhydro-N-acetylmuramic acid kinase [Solirubrobacter deserti]MBE2316124.1 anhydro-N-acetylmuramic acid kinase [Solirubrobacter deserti]MDA0136874.1 anhydro-N-acetylmuramic acid kinase [Solirubrobacter deserti]
MRVVGIMSGTSLDAIDAAVADITLEGETVALHPLGSVRALYDDDLREGIVAALPPARTTMEAVCRLDTRIGQAFAEVAVAAIELAGPVDLIASHGQTLFHWVEDGAAKGTLQLGQPAWIAERTRVPVISDFRARDIAAGGQGAPLVALLDTLLLAGRPGRPAALNLGGIANLTVPPLAFDTGPGNALLDAVAPPYDEGGARAAAGTVIRELLDRLLADPYYARPAPKSTGKEHFNLAYLGDLSAYATDDVLATLTELTARTVLDAAREHGATELIVSGGGVHNATLLARLAAALPTTTSDTLGLPAQDKEAYAFALLGFLTIHGLPGTLARTTGARRPAILGSITPGLETGPAPKRLAIM